MNLAVRSAIYGDRSLEETARAIAEAGYEAVQLDLDLNRLGAAEGGLTAAVAGRMAEAMEREKLTVAAVRVEVDLVGGGVAAVSRVVELLQRADDFGTDLLITTSGPGSDWTEAIGGLEEVVAVAAEHDIGLAVELAPGMAIADLDDAELLLETIEQDNLGLAMDLLAEAERQHLSPADLLERVGDALLAATLTDASTNGDRVAPSPRSATDFGELVDLLNQYSPDVLIVAGGVQFADAAATRHFLARFL
ncbi:MAG: TIM barrel protein [Armatimonadetes bacterium]|nr:TIM barrel protein [Armatimonadota bacterium]